MKVVIFMLFGVLCTLCGCTLPSTERPIQVSEVPVAVPESFRLWEPCDAIRAEEWRTAADESAAAALRGAACYAYLVERADGDLATAVAGKQLAEQAVAAYPQSAEAHYLLGYLAGLEAQRSPLRALSMVPLIESEALTALALNPELDQAGPARMLGDLYLRAPVFPVSIGDSALAVDYFRQAVKLAPDHPENHLGLVEALLAEEQGSDACLQLLKFWQLLAPEEDSGSVWQRGLELQRRICEELSEH